MVLLEQLNMILLPLPLLRFLGIVALVMKYEDEWNDDCEGRVVRVGIELK